MPRIVAIVMLLCVAATGAAAQNPFVPPEFYNPNRPADGPAALSFCVFSDTSTAQVDTGFAQAIADSLLVEPVLKPVELKPGTRTDDEFWRFIFLLLAEQCTAIMGIEIVPGTALPDWLTMTRPYYRAPYVLATRDPAIADLGSLGPGALLSVPINSRADLALQAYERTVPQGQGWLRIPYQLPEDQFAHLRDGVVAAAVMWEPTLQALIADTADAAGIAMRPLDPVPAVTRDLAILLRSDDGALRVSLDSALGALAAQGVDARQLSGR